MEEKDVHRGMRCSPVPLLSLALLLIVRQHKYSTANFKISHRKLNLLSRQIAGKPIDHAILQMQFSEKRASKRIKSMLVVAKSHATKLKSLDEGRLVVGQSLTVYLACTIC